MASKALTKAPPEAPAVNFPVARPSFAKVLVSSGGSLFTPEARMPEGKGFANGIEMKQLGGPSNPGWAGEWITQQGSLCVACKRCCFIGSFIPWRLKSVAVWWLVLLKVLFPVCWMVVFSHFQRRFHRRKWSEATHFWGQWKLHLVLL